MVGRQSPVGWPLLARTPSVAVRTSMVTFGLQRADLGVSDTGLQDHSFPFIEVFLLFRVAGVQIGPCFQLVISPKTSKNLVP